jgi:hypothetical protein
MTTEEFKELCEARLVDAQGAARLGGYSYRQGLWRAIQSGLMPRPILRFAQGAFWDAEEIEQARAKRAA